MKKRSPFISHSDSVLLRRMAVFRYQLRRFLRFSEHTSRVCGTTPQQYQLLMGVAGFTQEGSANISELAEFLQERHNAVVGLVARAAKRGLVRKERSSEDKRIVRVSITHRGAAMLLKIARQNLRELERVKAKLPRGFKLPHSGSRAN
jgi:DNA-binding MarR family transcriptional regulator